MFGFLEWLTFDGLVKALHDAAVAVFEVLRDALYLILTPLFVGVAAAVSAVHPYVAQLDSVLSGVSPYLQFANAWVPVDLFFQLVSVYSTLWLVLLVYRTVKSWLPTVSGS